MLTAPEQTQRKHHLFLQKIHCQRTWSLAVGRPPGWVDTDVSRLYIGINPTQTGGRPRGLLQSLGGWSNALMARWWPCLESECATWPKKCSRLVLEILETGEQPVVSLTEVLVTCLLYGIRRIFRRDHVSRSTCWPQGQAALCNS